MTVDANSKDPGTRNAAKFTKEELRDCFTLKTDCVCDTKQKVGKRWPDYKGPTTLRSSGCTDEPLLAVAELLKETVRFVHLVDENEDEIDRAGGNDDEEKEGLEIESSDSENEFE